ncbi:MAG: hypothetical protein LBS84_12950 [Clostridiales bacterium]|jgi:hypothetical protein|nr:hypothetical protein [Clostridiales bacterium]
MDNEQKFTPAPAAYPEDRPSTGMAVLGFLIPIAGLILWLVWKDTKPLKAKSAGKGALVSVIIGVLFYVVVVVIALNLM